MAARSPSRPSNVSPPGIALAASCTFGAPVQPRLGHRRQGLGCGLPPQRHRPRVHPVRARPATAAPVSVLQPEPALWRP
eukprot:7179821-Pyramimonas_sp.AAC.1